MGLQDVWSFFVGEAQEVANGSWFVPGFSNLIALETDEGLLMVDTGARHQAAEMRSSVRAKTERPVHTVLFTHGHFDHAFGLGPWLEHGDTPTIIAHRDVQARFRRYEKTAKLNERINSIQFGVAKVDWPRTFDWPDVTYETKHSLVLGGECFELFHARGETDDATWLWAPSRKLICAGDLWIGCAPNAGNPQKVQRYAEEWAEAFEAMAKMDAEVFLPGHGPPVTGRETIASCLTDAARYLRSIVEQTMEGLEAGLRYDEVMRSIRVPVDLADRPFLAPLYDRPEFIARNVMRHVGGWWDGWPSTVLPPDPTARAKEVASLAGGVEALIARARGLVTSDIALSCQLAEWALLADPASYAAKAAVRDIFGERAAKEPSLMARSIFLAAVRDAE